MKIMQNAKTMKPYTIYQDSKGGQYVKGNVGGGYTINYNDGSHWDYCLEKESDILAKTVNTDEIIKLEHYPCDMTKILAIENELDDASLAFLHKLDTFSKIPRLQMLSKTENGLPEAVKYVLNLGESLRNDLYLTDSCLYALDFLRNIEHEMSYGQINPQKEYNLNFDEYYLFNQIVNDYRSINKICDAAGIVQSNDPNKDEWYRVCDFVDEENNEKSFEEWWDSLDDIEREEYNRSISESEI